MRIHPLGLALTLLFVSILFSTGCALPHRQPPMMPPPAPAVVAPAPGAGGTQPKTTAPETVVVVIRNPNGSKTPVQLTRVGPQQWKGPQGEVYHQIPSEEQLRPAYGLR